MEKKFYDAMRDSGFSSEAEMFFRKLGPCKANILCDPAKMFVRTVKTGVVYSGSVLKGLFKRVQLCIFQQENLSVYRAEMKALNGRIDNNILVHNSASQDGKKLWMHFLYQKCIVSLRFRGCRSSNKIACNCCLSLL